jgi:lipoate-protein ligase A
MEEIKFRLILSPEKPGAWNMAIDEAIMDQVKAQNSPPTIRLYRWCPPCFSLGQSQPISDVNFAKLSHLKWDIVRRPTGGRAILHTDELTYSVIAPINNPLVTGTLLESYQRISDALVFAMHNMGVPALASQNNPPIQINDVSKPVCFEVPSTYEIICNKKKLIGSAQLRRDELVLQHGAIPLFGDITRIALVLSSTTPENESSIRTRISSHATTLEEILYKRVSWDACASAIQKGFSMIGVRFEENELTHEEKRLAASLVTEKYANDKWTLRI